MERKPFEDPVEKNCIEIGCKHENVCKWYAEVLENQDLVEVNIHEQNKD